MLQMRHISKAFPGVQALDAVEFSVEAGEIHALVGENGAGKSTLIKVLTGVYRRDGGQIFVDQRPIDPRTPAEAEIAGISTVYQEVNLIPALSVAENILLGRQPRRWGMIRWREMRRRAEAALSRLGIDIDVTRPVASYSLAIGQMVAIARALDINSRILVFDEPTSSLDEQEVAELFRIMRTLRQRGLGIVFITHFLDQVYAVSDRITVLRNGKCVGTHETAGLSRIELIGKMLGTSVVEQTRNTANESQPVPAQRQAILRASGLARRGSLAPFDLEIAAGEIVGLAGLLGSGRTELARLLFGVDRADQGELFVRGRRQVVHSPRQAIRNGLAFCSEDRQTEGILPNHSVRENMLLVLQAQRGWWRPIARSQQTAAVDEYCRRLHIRLPNRDAPIRNLSGGNQQKVMLARWLLAQPILLLLDEPTRGIDIGARDEIERLIAELCRQGMAILFISSELDEIVRVAQRVVVLRERQKVAELSGNEIDEQRIMHIIALGHATNE